MDGDMAAFSGTQAAAVLDKLEARQEARKAEREQRQQELEKVADPREDIQRFLEAFSKDHCDLQQRCSDLEQRAAASGQDDSEKQAILQQLEDIAGHTSVLEQKISDAAYFLPPYDLRSCNGHLQQLRSQLAAIKQQLQPKRKFAFSKAVKKTHVAAPAVAAQQPADTAPVDQSTAADAAPAGPTSHDLQLISAGYGFMGLRNQSIIQTAEHLAGQAFVLHDLAECTVYLLGHMSALRLQKLQNCRVYTGPVSGATFVSGASGCTLMIASHQVRIHDAKSCNFYLRVRSRPIIEHSSGLRFAPYPLNILQQQQQQDSSNSKSLQQLFQDGQLSRENDLWQQVDDFGWVKATQSPHWSVLPEQERQQPVVQQQQQ